MFSQPQHIGVVQFSARPVAGEGFVHYGSIANPLEIVNNWFCSHLFLDPLKFQEHIGINVADLRVKTGAFPCSQGNLETCDNIKSGASSEPVLSDSLSQVLGTLWYLDAIAGF